jgi:subtilisin family serine protease
MLQLLPRAPRVRTPSFFVAVLSLTSIVLLTPRLLGAQSRQARTTVSVDDRGVATTDAVESAPAFHPSRALVHFRRGAPGDVLPGSRSVKGFPGDRDLFLVENPPGLSVGEVLRRYHANPNVLYAEPDYLVNAIAAPTDPRWAEQWDMVKIAAPAAWDTQTSASDVVVAIIDTGIDFTHPDLQPNLWSNTDGSHGYTCMNGTCVIGGADDFGHGTHVAGTIGAAANNGIGIAGINWNVQLLSLKFLGSSGSGYTSDAILCFNLITQLKQQGVNIRVSSNSWGGGGFDQSLKDAMAQAEAAGVVHVCAAGNSGANADAFPMYPAAYDKCDLPASPSCGIISVLATDQNDAGAGFSNYGLASVDIAAPGVSTLSTVPTGSCSLCDASGYKLLSGTSMATPHVSGVLAALFHRNPALTTNEARDLVLDPRSYDSLTDTKANTSSTGGRLNFAKALANPFNPVATPNHFPALTMGPNVFASAGSQVNLSASASDPDNDPLRMSWVKSASAGSLWLFGSVLNTLFPTPSGNTVSFTAPSLARTALVSYDASAADGRGGSDHGRDYVTVSPAANPGGPPNGTLDVSPTPTPGQYSVRFPATDPDGGGVNWDLWIGQNGGASGTCCFQSSATATVNLNPGVYRISTQAIDTELNLSPRASTVVLVGGATGDPPTVDARADKMSGQVPLTVTIDMGASSGTITSYFFNCGGGTFTPGARSSLGSCTFNTPGTYWMRLQVSDADRNNDIMSLYAVATPPASDTQPPNVAITAPEAGSHVSESVTITADATDDVGVTRVDYYLDSGSTPIGSATGPGPSYSIVWDASTTAAGPHMLHATAIDAAGNTGTSSAISITVDAVPFTPPTASITSPADQSTVARKSTVPITASVTAGTNPVDHVDFLVGSTVVCSDFTAPYQCNWVVPPAMNKTYQIRANAYDTAGNVGAPNNVVTVTAK